LSNSYALPITNAKAAGIVTVAASGNEGYIDGISKPACTPGAVSVGAVYDANVGGLQYAKCTDSTTAADQIACFSDSASFLTVLAPGAIIAAAGYSMTGTSQATPHVTGAVAVLRAAFPGETVDQTISRLTSTGHLVTDPRNGIVKPRINLLEAARPANDTFLNRLILTGNSGAASGINILATKEAGEPAHAANAGGKSVWWKWTAPAAGQVSLDTHGSSFNTLLAVYSGSAVGGLAPVAGNDNDGSANNNSGLLFQAQAGAEYEIAVDGNNGAAGSLALNWTLNTTAKADLSVAISSSFSPPGGSNLVYAIVVTNNGPQTATNTNLTLNLAPNLSLISMSPDCTAAGAVIGCSLGSLANGAVSNIQVTVVPATSGNFTTSATVSSDLPDLSATNSSSSISTPVTIADTDIPMLPWWGELMIGMLLLGSIYVKEGRRG
jgi:uncharacterized repeat protein (TIGR01451 family)